MFNFRIKLEENFTSFWVNGSKHIDLQLPEKFFVCRSQTVSQTIVLASHHMMRKTQWRPPWEKHFTFPECYVKTPYNEAFSGIFFTRVQTLNQWNFQGNIYRYIFNTTTILFISTAQLIQNYFILVLNEAICLQIGSMKPFYAHKSRLEAEHFRAD